MAGEVCMQLMPVWCVQFMGDIVQPASKDAGGLVHGTVTDLKEQVGMPLCPVTCLLCSRATKCCRDPFCAVWWSGRGRVFQAVWRVPHCTQCMERHDHNSKAAYFEKWKAAFLHTLNILVYRNRPLCMGMQVAMPLAHDIADNARPKTEEFIENVMRPAVQDLIKTLEKQADEMSKKVYIYSPGFDWRAAGHLLWSLSLSSAALLSCFTGT